MKLSVLLRWNDYHNLPKKFIERAKFEGTTVDSNYFLRREREISFVLNYRYTRFAPWTTYSRMLNRKFARQREPLLVLPIKDWVYFRGDKHYRKSGGDNGLPERCVKEEQPLLVTNDVALVDPYDEKPCEVEWRYTEGGEKVRVSKRTQRIIPIPKQAEETIDYKTKNSYQPGEKDCPNDEVLAKSYIPTNKICYDELMEHYGIKESRKPGPTYVY